MSMRRFKRLGMALSAVAVLLTLSYVGHAQIGGPSCSCAPILSLAPNTNCPCPGITLTNLTTSRFGNCKRVGLTCDNTISTKKCKLAGTVSETGCAGGFVDEPFSILADCLSFDNMVADDLACTSGGGLNHQVRLNCKACKP